MGIFDFGKPKRGIRTGSLDAEIRRAQAQERKKQKREAKAARLEAKRQRELKHLRAETELYSARARHVRAKHAASHTIKRKKTKLIRRSTIDRAIGSTGKIRLI